MNVFRRLGDVTENAGRSVLNAGISLLPNKPTWVQIELEGTVPERKVPRTLAQKAIRMVRHSLSVEELSERLFVVAHDPSVDGVVLRAFGLTIGMAKAQSLRDLLVAVRARGKKVVVYTDHLDANTIVLASGADRLVVPESTDFDVRGIAVEMSFLKSLLDRVGIAVDVEAIGEYKTAMDAMRRERMSHPHREMLDAILDALFDELVETIASGRRLERGDVVDALDAAPMPADEAQKRGLIDAVLWEDELPGWLGKDKEPARIERWERAQLRLHRPYRWPAERSIGIVSLTGTIVTGRSRRLPVSLPMLGLQAGAETVGQCLRAAEKDHSIAAVVLHVDSPGGSALASDLIWREVARLRRKKPVVAWFGALAASGGYYAACAANAIVAQPATLTGSIGVIAAKGVLGGLYERLGVHRERIERGRMAGMFSSDRPFDELERKRVQDLVRRSYDRFKLRVTEGRSLDPSEVERLARGRVYAARQVAGGSLIDELGDIEVAIARAKALAGLEGARDVAVVQVNPPRSRLAAPDVAAAAFAELPEALAALSRESVLAIVPWELQVGP